MANEAKMIWGATISEVITQSADLATTNNSYTNGTLFTNTDMYPLATATLHCPDGWLTTAPDEGSTVDLYMVRYNVNGTADSLPVPSSVSDLENAEYVGSFLVSTQATASAEYRNSITISLAGVKAAMFYIENNTGETIDYVSTDITVHVEPFTYGPA